MTQPLKNLERMSPSELEAEIRRHNRLYWDENAPEISDPDYDRLVRRLKELKPDSAVLQEMGPSPEGRYGAEVRHRTPMLSLDKCYNDEDLHAWASKFSGDVVATPKMDGIAASLIYDERGRLATAATRGSGVVGDDITTNVLGIADVPKKIPQKNIEIRGEVYMRLSVFGEFGEQFANPRNLAAGAIKQKDPEKSRAYRLSFTAYDVLGSDAETETEKFALIAKWKFPEVPYRKVSPEKLREAYDAIASQRDALDYEIDGVVYKANNVAEQQRLGSTAHHPRYAIAYKFQGDAGTSTLEAVEWSVARTGVITPIARITPLELSGAMISRASLHHAGFVDKLGLTLGAEVEVTRRGGVIPKVERVVKPGTKPVPFPTSCPGCGGPVYRQDDFLYCADPDNCRIARIGAMAHFVGVVDIQGFGEKLLTAGYDQGLLKTPADIYRLQRDDLLKLERIGEKTADNLLAQVAAHREMPLSTFLRSLGVDELSKHASSILEQHYGTLERVLEVSEAELSEIHGIGPKIAAAVVQGLAKARPTIRELLRYVTIVEHAKAPAVKGPLSNKSFVFTGKLIACERKQAQEWVKKLGGTTPDGVTKDLTYLVIGDGKEDAKSSKQVKAEKLIASGESLKIISEREFLRMTGN